MKKSLLLSLIIVTLFSACQKESANTVCIFDASGITGTWKLTGLKIKPDANTAEVDLYATLDVCEKDDVLVFNTNGTYNYNDIGAVCTPSGSDAGTWSVSGNALTVDGEAWQKQSFSCSSLVLKLTDPTTGGYTLLTLTK
ncbi:MAG: lipocalin family protein [Ferruginibacter sp.]